MFSKEANKLLFERYPEVAIYYLYSLIFLAVEMFDQLCMLCCLTVKCNRVHVYLYWPYYLFHVLWDFWGAFLILNPKFFDVFSEKNWKEDSTVYGLIHLIFWYRMVSSIVHSILIIYLITNFYKWKTSRNTITRRESKENIENLVISQFPSKISMDTRVYNEKTDAIITCAICLGNLCDTPHKELVQLECNENHVFHSHCLSGWLAKSMQCPMCRAPI